MWGGVPVCGVSSVQPHPVEPQGNEATDDRSQRPCSRQQQLHEAVRCPLLQACTLINGTHQKLQHNDRSPVDGLVGNIRVWIKGG